MSALIPDVSLEPTGTPGGMGWEQVTADRLGLPTRVAVIDRRPTLRADVARATLEAPDLELALSSDCLQDALALLAPLDLILLGRCRDRAGSACDLVGQVTASGRSVLVVVDSDPGSGSDTDRSPGSCAAQLGADARSALASEDCSDEDVVRQAIYAAMGSPAPTQPPSRTPSASLPDCPSFSAQESRALALYSSGLTLDAVAAAMYVSTNTAATYLRRVRMKFRASGSTVDSKLELRELAITLGLIEGRSR